MKTLFGDKVGELCGDVREGNNSDDGLFEDDKEVLPAGYIIFVTKKATVEKAGKDYEETILQVQEGLTLKVMQELDARVELEKQTPKEAAAAYLKSAGYVG